MTTHPGPIPLTVTTLYCRTAERRCEYYEVFAQGDMACWSQCRLHKESPFLAARRNCIDPAPAWCPLRSARTTHAAPVVVLGPPEKRPCRTCQDTGEICATCHNPFRDCDCPDDADGCPCDPRRCDACGGVGLKESTP